MNLYEATVTGSTMQLGSHSIELGEVPAEVAARDGRTLVVGIRPEDMDDANLSEGDTSGHIITATASLVESLGSEIMVHFEIDARAVDAGDPDVLEELSDDEVADAVARFNPRSRARAGQPISAAIDIERLHFFDLDTGLALR